MSVLFFIQDLIADENPLAVEHDLNVIDKARSLQWDEDGWKELQSKCITNTAKNEIHSIEMRKYHRAEYACEML